MKRIILLFLLSHLLLAGETTATYKVEGMMCAVSCPKAIQKSLKDVEGVKSCIIDFDSKTATVTFDNEKISRDKIANTITEGTYFKVNDTEKKSWSFFRWLFGKS